MSTPNSKSTGQIDQQAADWFTLLRSSEKTVDTEMQFSEWLGETAEHGHAYRRIEKLWETLGELAATPELEALRQTAEVDDSNIRPEQQTHVSGGWLQGFFTSLFGHKVGFAALASLVIVTAVFMFPRTADEIVVASHQSLTGQILTVELDGGKTLVTLAPETQIKAWTTPTERHVELLNGEAFFDVAGDRQRPFFVLADDTLIKVVGTRFDVRKGTGLVSVAVLEGVVNVTEAERAGVSGPARASVVLGKGQQVVKPGNKAFEPVTTISAAELGAWRGGRLVYRDTALLDLISDANRYFDGTISLAEDDLADLRVTATIRTDQVAHLPKMLAQSLPITVQALAENQFVISRSRPEAD